MQIRPIKLYSKSSVERDWRCPRSYYYSYEYDGTGIQQHSTSLELHLGITLHDALAVLALKTKAIQDSLPGEQLEPVDYDLIASTAYEQTFRPLYDGAQNPDTGEWIESRVTFAKEQATLVEGLIRGFIRHVWPSLCADYRILSVELPSIYRHGQGLGMVAKPDLILQDHEGLNWYFEYKSTSSKKEEWIESWKYSTQLHSSIRAVEQTHGIKIDGVIIQGLYKGYRSHDRQNSPLVYAYYKKGNPPFSKDQYAYDYKPGFFKAPVWDLDGGSKEWIAKMPTNILADQFPRTPPIFINDYLIDSFFQQQESRQAIIQRTSDYLARFNDHLEGSWADTLTKDAKSKVLDEVFPQRFDQCRPSYGHECNFLRLCHGNIDDPYEAGFVPRTTDHLQPFLDLLTDEERGNVTRS